MPKSILQWNRVLDSLDLKNHKFLHQEDTKSKHQDSKRFRSLLDGNVFEYWRILEVVDDPSIASSSPALSAQLVPAGTSAMKTGPAFRPHRGRAPLVRSDAPLVQWCLRL